MNPAHSKNSVAGRLKRLAAFVAIVWALAGSFAAFEVAMLSGTDLLLAFPQWFGSFLLPSATRSSKSCEAQPGASADRRATGLTESDARVASWVLGIGVGQDARVRQSTQVDLAALAASMARVRELANLLGAPAPAMFQPEQKLLANIEFGSFLERDAQGTAHQVALAYSPRSCQAYKLGALWGYSMVGRAALPGERPTFSVEILHYARLVGLPEELSRPMIARTPRNATFDELNAQNLTITENVTKFLSAPR